MPENDPAPATGAGTSTGTAASSGAPGTPAATAGSAAPSSGATTPPTPAVTVTVPGADEPLGEPGKRALDAERKTAKAEKDRADKLEAELTAIRDKDLSESQRLAKENEALKAAQEEWQVERATLHLQTQVASLSGKLGIIDSDVVTRLIEWDDLEFDKAGTPQNVEAIVTEIIKQRPFLAKATSGGPQPAQNPGINSGAGAGAGTPPALNAAELEAAAQSGLSPERYNALKSVSTLGDWLKTRTPTGG